MTTTIANSANSRGIGIEGSTRVGVGTAGNGTNSGNGHNHSIHQDWNASCMSHRHRWD